MSAFESITTRQSWYAAAATAQYAAVEFDADGKYQLADGTGIFAGICQYGCDDGDQMITVVKGTYPGVGSESIAAGDKLTIDASDAGKFKPAETTDAVYGVALSAGAAGELVSVAIVESPIPGIVEESEE